MKITKLQLYTNQLQDLKVFYVMVLGFELQNENETAFTLKAGNSLLEFRWNPPGENTNPSYHFAFNIPENQIEEARRWLYTRSIPLLKHEGDDILDFPHWNANALYFLDPSNNIVEFIARHDLNNTSEASFSAQSICSVSEIGLPVPNLPGMHQQVKEKLGLSIYSKVGNTTNFCPMGTPDGLFIIVRTNRTWLPTELPNGVYPTVVTIEGETPDELTFDEVPYIVRVAHS
ncbi:VOC family protein [Microscilla marina]|uniref:Glyoxalase family protein n=1 Tax=Microscilla marina ATCC 23134 TaxID=313606 RepID=A1ZNP3_MICM2|nr:VOC family protein [Microscilla marina]EAY27932.1 glyoxalase family protein [Microscilla marina ATCC 23134]